MERQIDNPGPVGLGGEERIENLVCLLRRQPHAGVAHADSQLIVFVAPLDGELAGTISLLHGIDTVGDEVHHDLLQLHAVSDDVGKIPSELHADGYGESRDLAVQ
jgi:hypothetical protein